MTILTVASILIGVGCCIVGEILLPFLVGVLAALYLFDKDERKYSFITSCTLLVLNLAGVALGFVISFFGLAAIILARMLNSAYKKNNNKADTAYVMTVIFGAFTVLGAVFFAMVYMNSYTMDAAVTFYSDLVSQVRKIFVETTMDIYAQTGMQIGEDIVVSAFDQQVNMIISYVLIGAFAMTGISMKLFSAIVSRCVDDNSSIRSWRFIANGACAYLYVILALGAIFVLPTDVLGISVLNLYNFFMCVFAYVGFNYALALFRRRMKKVASFILLVVILLVASSIAIQILAFLGVFFTIRKSRENKPYEG